MQLLKSFDFYPDCFSMRLEALPIESNLTNTEQFTLYLTLNFNQQWCSLLNGSIKFGLKSGELTVELINSTIDSLDPQIEQYFEVSKNTSQNNEIIKLRLKTSPAVLATSFEKIKLGTLQILSSSYLLKVTFSILPSALTLTNAEGLWRHDISPNKYAVLERSIVFFLVKNQFPSHLSALQIGSDHWKSEDDVVVSQQSETTPQVLDKLQQLIQTIYQAETDDIQQLAKLAQLNLKTDFAGGNLLATNLTGIDLNNANFKGANLRGSDLTDADLNEANLSYTNLSGADLSGAYLENANLSYADLHRASLALTNLIGADLSNANLVETNLSNVNLNRAKVTAAKLGNNPGISEETKLILEQRGAIQTISL
jgi:hypothetical protein